MINISKTTQSVLKRLKIENKGILDKLDFN